MQQIWVRFVSTRLVCDLCHCGWLLWLLSNVFYLFLKSPFSMNAVCQECFGSFSLSLTLSPSLSLSLCICCILCCRPTGPSFSLSVVLVFCNFFLQWRISTYLLLCLRICIWVPPPTLCQHVLATLWIQQTTASRCRQSPTRGSVWIIMSRRCKHLHHTGNSPLGTNQSHGGNPHYCIPEWA